MPGITFRFTFHLNGAIVKQFDNDFFFTALQHAIKESGIRGVITLGGVKYTQGGVTLVVNMDEHTHMDVVAN